MFGSFLMRVAETTVVHLTAGAAAETVKRGFDKAQQFVANKRKPNYENAIEVEDAMDEMRSDSKRRSKDI